MKVLFAFLLLVGSLTAAPKPVAKSAPATGPTTVERLTADLAARDTQLARLRAIEVDAILTSAVTTLREQLPYYTPEQRVAIVQHVYEWSMQARAHTFAFSKPAGGK